MHPNLHLLAMTALLLSGCASMDSNYGSSSSGSGASAEQVAQWKEATRKAQSRQDSAQCVDFGYKPGTTEYAKCRENLFNQRQAAKTAAASRPVIIPPPPPPAPIMAAPAPAYVPQKPYMLTPLPKTVTTQCQTYANGNVICNTR